MANTILHKRSATAAKVPQTSDLQLGELAINTYDGKLYIKKNDGSESIVEIGGLDGDVTLTGDLTVPTLNATAVKADNMPGRNRIINGNFDIWQRSANQTSSGYGSDDRWFNQNVGSTKTASRQTFALGQTDVPNNPRYYCRTVVTSVAGANNFVIKLQRIEGVNTFAGETVTLSFYAKADASKNMTIDFVQKFGTGGSPSSSVTAIGVQKLALTTSWQKYTVTAAMPSIVGKTLGTDNNDFLALTFWFDGGSAFDSRTDSLGHQSGTFDIAQVQLEAGAVATEFEQEDIGTTLLKCQRYYQEFRTLGSFGNVTAGLTPGFISEPFNPRMRIPDPTVSVVNWSASNFPTTPVAVVSGLDRVQIQSTASNTGYGGWFGYGVTADAEL